MNNQKAELNLAVKFLRRKIVQNAQRSAQSSLSNFRSQLWEMYDNSEMSQEDFRRLEQMVYQLSNEVDRVLNSVEVKETL